MSKLSPLPIVAPPGVVLTETGRVAEGRWTASRNIRFVKGLPQKIGGWEQAFTEPTDGTPRAMHAWRDNDSVQYIAVGTYKKLYVYDADLAQNDITPFRDEGSLTNPFSTTSGSNVVEVEDAGHGLGVGDIIYYSGASSVGGLDLNGQHVVNTVIDTNNYAITASSNATSTATGGGTVDFSYEIQIGVETGAYGYGWGVGGWGLGTWGTSRDVSTIFIEPRVWSLDHFGKFLIGTYNTGTIYIFDPTQAKPWPRATPADPSAPDNARSLFVTPERFVMALLDNMQIAWCSQGDYTIWTPAIGNTANIRTLTEGTKLVSGRVLADFVSLIWTDAALYRFQYTGTTYVYNSSMVAKDCGLISPGAAVTAGGIAFWMGADTFWMYDGGSVRPMPNVEDIRSFVFRELDVNMVYQTTSVFSPQHNEVWFFYTVSGENNPSKGVVFSIENQCWAPLDFGRAGGTHLTQGDTRPYMGTGDGFIMQHEIGYDADGEVLPASLTLAPFAMSEGYVHMDVEYFVPDFKDQVGAVTMTVTTMDRLNDSHQEDQESESIAVMDSGTIDLRVSGRYLGLMLESNSSGCYFRFGKPVAFIRPSGVRS